MKTRLEYLLLVIVIVAAAAYLMFRESDRTRYVLPKLPEVSATALTRLEILKGNDTIVLSRKKDRWYLSPGDVPADREKVADLLDAAAALFLSARVSESKNYARYDLGEDKRIHVKAFAGGTVKREFDIGSTASTFRHTHVKIAGDPNVYQAQGNLKAKFNVTVASLRDKTVLSFEKADVRELSITFQGKSLRLIRPGKTEKPAAKGENASKESQKAPQKEGDAWQTQDGKPVDAAKITHILSSLTGLKCQDYIQGSKKEDFKDPEIEIVVTGKAKHVLKLFKKQKKEAKTRPGISSDNAYPFLIADGQIRAVTALVQDMNKATPEN